MPNRPLRAALYARVSTNEQTADNQLLELRRYVEARGWTALEFVDEGVSGARESRPALDQMLKDARHRRFDVVLCWRLDRLARSLKHLVTMVEEFQALGIAFVSLTESIDATTPGGKLQLHLFAALAEFERSLISSRVRLGMQRARAQGKHLGRPRRMVTDADLTAVRGLPLREAASQLGVSKSFVHKWRVSTRGAAGA
jgi:DNA invertase Pin-like site-specific DNA recombinase